MTFDDLKRGSKIWIYDISGKYKGKSKELICTDIIGYKTQTVEYIFNKKYHYFIDKDLLFDKCMRSDYRFVFADEELFNTYKRWKKSKHICVEICNIMDDGIIPFTEELATNWIFLNNKLKELNIDQVCDYLKVSESEIKQYLSSDIYKYAKIKSTNLIYADDILKYKLETLKN